MATLVPATQYKGFTDEYAFHALKREDDGLLVYTKVKLAGHDKVNLTTGEGFAYGSLGSVIENKTNADAERTPTQDGVAESGLASWQENKGFINYEQHIFENNKLNFYMDEDGNFVMRYLDDYPWAAQDGATRNWKR